LVCIYGYVYTDIYTNIYTEVFVYLIAYFIFRINTSIKKLVESFHYPIYA